MNYLKNPYHQINIVFITVIVFIFIYSLILNPKGNHYIFTSACKDLPAKYCPSLGLQHSFSEIVRGNLGKASEYNPYGIRIFSFFLIQFFQRIGISAFLLMNSSAEIIRIAIADGCISTACFIVTFYPFIVL